MAAAAQKMVNAIFERPAKFCQEEKAKFLSR